MSKDKSRFPVLARQTCDPVLAFNGFSRAVMRPTCHVAQPGLCSKERSRAADAPARYARTGGSQSRTSVSRDGQRNLRERGKGVWPAASAPTGCDLFWARRLPGHLGGFGVLRPDPGRAGQADSGLCGAGW